METVKAWISAARLRTLPLSVSGILVGTALANSKGYSDTWMLILCLATTVCYQITSNFANDYGDGMRGTDGADRIGPKRALQSGALRPGQLKWGVGIGALISFLLSLALIFYAFGTSNTRYVLLFSVLGLASIWAAIKYTMGKNPYGYLGLGDLFVFLFFGLLSVLGSQFLFTKALHGLDLMPAIAIGFFCVGVLNLNNMRDRESDIQHGKNTMAVKLGATGGKRYHAVLILLGLLLSIVHAGFLGGWILGASLSLPWLLIFLHLIRVLKAENPQQFDPELKKLALSTFLLSLLFITAINYFL
ncbi:MAG: 1,4-dihydroxy-2-naphthoate octaprenyltransferase [Flavobacteriaceae bacterium]|nr:1,4-dihydroxy-2-naphthoate octaprenyltransferase [Flavobacteriaceae bacterium]